MSCRSCLEPLEPNSSLRLSIVLPMGRSIEEIIRFFVPKMVTLKLNDWLVCPKCVDTFREFTYFVAHAVAVGTQLKDMDMKQELTQNISKDTTEACEMFTAHANISNGEDSSNKSNSETVKVIQSETPSARIELDTGPILPVVEKSAKVCPPKAVHSNINISTATDPKNINLKDAAEENNVIHIIDSDVENENSALLPLKTYLRSTELEFSKMVRVTKKNEELPEILNKLTSTNVNIIDLKSPQASERKRILLLCASNKEKERNSTNTMLKSCPVCKEYFKTGNMLGKHLLLAHKDYSAFECVVCHKNFKRSYAFNKHLEYYERYKSCYVKECVICREIMVGKNVKVHMDTHKNFQCDLCIRKFISPFALSKHRAWHEMNARKTPVPFVKKFKKELCPICGKMINAGTGMRVHMRTHSEDPSFLCEKCPKILKSRAGLSRHTGIVHCSTILECPVCKKKITKNGLRAHMNLKHSDRGPSHACHICDKTFMRGDYYRKHMNSHMILTKAKRKRYYKRYGESGFPCKYCHRTYKNVHQLRIHLIDSHLKNAVRPKCQFCNMTFRDKSSRARHEKKHKDPIFELTCKVCWNKFDSKESLESHQLKHKNSKKRQCEECGEWFPSKYFLYHHMNEKHYNENLLEQRRRALLEDGLSEFILKSDSDEDKCDSELT